MNIFATSPNPIISAQELDDVRLRKMVLETAQLLCTAVHERPELAPQSTDLYRSTHRNHPCSIWTRESYDNFNWLSTYFSALGAEYQERFGKDHASHTKFCNHFIIPYDETPRSFADCTPYRGVDEDDVHTHYRKYLNDKWASDIDRYRFPQWTNRGKPDWATMVKSVDVSSI